jgi:hypothetical protein
MPWSRGRATSFVFYRTDKQAKEMGQVFVYRLEQKKYTSVTN